MSDPILSLQYQAKREVRRKNMGNNIDRCNIVDFGYLLLMMNHLVELGLITEEHKARAAQRIADENELSLLFI
jgi:hypothetical protein